MERLDSPDHCVLPNWHIHVGERDLEALQRNAWDADICYLPASPEQGDTLSQEVHQDVWKLSCVYLFLSPCLEGAVYGACQGGEPLTKVYFAGHPSSLPDCPLSCASFVAALKNGHRDCLSYWHIVRHMYYQKERNRDYGPFTCCEAAQMPSAKELMYVHDVLGLPWGAATCKVAAWCGSIDCLSYAHASGCRWDSRTCAAAASAGSLRCLAYAHEHGCEWNSLTLHIAARKGDIDCLRYAHVHGCPYTANRPFCLDWIHSNTLWSSNEPSYLTAQAVFAGSVPCLAYVRARCYGLRLGSRRERVQASVSVGRVGAPPIHPLAWRRDVHPV